VILFEISGLSLQEIVEIQGGSLSGVKSRIVRGRERLAVLLGERKPSPSGTRAGRTAPRITMPTSNQRTQVAYSLREKI